MYTICQSKVPKFTLFKFVTLFQSFMPFSNPSCSLSSPCCYCLATTFPSLSAAVIPHTPLSLQFPFAIFVIPHSTCLLLYHSYQHTLRFPTTAFAKCSSGKHLQNASCKIIVSLDVFHSLPPNHTNQIAASIT